MSNHGRFRQNPIGELGRLIDLGIDAGQRKVQAADRFVRGRLLTSGERAMMEWMFGPNRGYSLAIIYPRNFWWPYRNDRAMAPGGHIHFPSQLYEEDFSRIQVPVKRRALFMHEATHLFQWYELRQHVYLRGLLDRNYDYQIEPGKALKDYGVEQMGQIVEDFYRLRHGVRPHGAGSRYRAEEYSTMLPVRKV